ncbi:hypothetical protein GOBAR_DD08485 [Gossypium barbadense]|nr:hypothetical protein GOBAR_DD08485 [Gossypium barbadense]
MLVVDSGEDGWRLNVKGEVKLVVVCYAYEEVLPCRGKVTIITDVCYEIRCMLVVSSSYGIDELFDEYNVMVYVGF